MQTRPLVLIVEDNTDLAEGLRAVLEDEGYDVARVANGRQALFALDGKLRPAVIILDTMMPVMDGPTFRAEQLQRHQGVAAIPVIGWSAYAPPADVDYEIIPKRGTSPKILLERIRSAAGPGVPEPIVSVKRPAMSARKLGAIAAVVTGIAAILKTLLDHFFPPKGRP